MAQYVKFLRGTPEAFAKLKHKDNDTLYFIYEEDELNGELYLGSKLIAGADCSCDESSTNTLAGLRDVLLDENIDYESLLVYDSNTAAWINKPLEDLIFMGATEHSAGIVGLVPAPKLGQVDLFLRSDGTWAAPTNSNHFILTIENKDHSSHKDLINSMLDNIDPSIGDIIIIKDLIFNNKWQHTAYVYDNNVWKAMDGNYNAENIYFDEDLVTTTAIGNITLENGLAVISTAGKNLKEVFETIFVKEEIPEVVLPKIVLNSNEAKQYEVGEKVKLSYNAQLDPGTYSFGPDTNVQVIGWKIEDNNGNSSTLNKDTFFEFVVGENTDYKITATVTHGPGEIPLTNLGNEYLAGQILANTITIENSFVTGYRDSFYGTLEEKNVLDSDVIRSLKHYGSKMLPGTSTIVNLPVGAKRVVFAYPASLPDLVSVRDNNGLDANIINAFKKSIIQVEGCDGYWPIDYKVYIIDFANPYNTANYYTFTIGKED